MAYGLYIEKQAVIAYNCMKREVVFLPGTVVLDD